jgi:hypothetical protein
MVLARQSHRHTHGKKQPQAGEDCIPGRGQHGRVEKVRLAQAQQQGCDRQHRDRQHQRATDLLQAAH